MSSLLLSDDSADFLFLPFFLPGCTRKSSSALPASTFRVDRRTSGPMAFPRRDSLIFFFFEEYPRNSPPPMRKQRFIPDVVRSKYLPLSFLTGNPTTFHRTVELFSVCVWGGNNPPRNRICASPQMPLCRPMDAVRNIFLDHLSRGVPTHCTDRFVTESFKPQVTCPKALKEMLPLSTSRFPSSQNTPKICGLSNCVPPAFSF